MSNSPWPSWLATEPEQVDENIKKVKGLANEVKAQLDALPPSVLALSTFAFGSVTAMSTVLFYKRYMRRIKNSEWVTPKQLTRKRWIRGMVTSVGDADNFRLYHTPPLGGYRWPIKFRSIPTLSKNLKNETLHIRIAGVDAPEAAHFGKPAQPYAAESLQWLREKVLGRHVYCQLLRKDQYSRVVAQVHLSPRILPGFLFRGKNLPAEMLKSGWATTYEQAGAEYGKLGKEGYLRLENEAKAARRGMWKHGTNIESPAEYKRRHAIASDAAEPAKPATPPSNSGKKSLWSKIFS
ncbi:SNase-domain-containing protein [Crassisporium funariophilum]|nr:SNase-domain-containing protein [Crassisporium funariophilum]